MKKPDQNPREQPGQSPGEGRQPHQQNSTRNNADPDDISFIDQQEGNMDHGEKGGGGSLYPDDIEEKEKTDDQQN